MTSKEILILLILIVNLANGYESNSSMENSKSELQHKLPKVPVMFAVAIVGGGIGALIALAGKLDNRQRHVGVENGATSPIILTCLEKGNNFGTHIVKSNECFHLKFDANVWGTSHIWCDAEISHTRKLTFAVYGERAGYKRMNAFLVKEENVFEKNGDQWTSIDNRVTKYNRFRLTVKNDLSDDVMFRCESDDRSEKAAEFKVEKKQEKQLLTKFVKDGEPNEKWECILSNIKTNLETINSFCLEIFNTGSALLDHNEITLKNENVSLYASGREENISYKRPKQCYNYK